jgi:hypothetical protein
MPQGNFSGKIWTGSLLTNFRTDLPNPPMPVWFWDGTGKRSPLKNAPKRNWQAPCWNFSGYEEREKLIFFKGTDCKIIPQMLNYSKVYARQEKISSFFPAGSNKS